MVGFCPPAQRCDHLGIQVGEMKQEPPAPRLLGTSQNSGSRLLNRMSPKNLSTG